MQIPNEILRSQTRVVIFDLDGTLYAKGGLVWRMMFALPLHWRRMLAERKTRKQMQGQFIGEHFYAQYFATLAEQCNLSAEEAKAWYEQVYMPQMVEQIGRHYPLAKWVMPFIEECRLRGIRMAVLSDYGHTYEKLAAIKLDKTYFDWVVAAPELGGLKPSVELLKEVAKQMGVAMEQCLVIGDRIDTDGEMAKNGGADFYLIKQ